MEEKNFSSNVMIIIDTLWVNQAWATEIAKALFEDYIIDFEKAYWYNSEPIMKDYLNWLNHKYEQSPYDDYQ